MNDRRQIIKKIGLGSVWVTPVVQSIVLPAHAQTSVCMDANVSVNIVPPVISLDVGPSSTNITASRAQFIDPVSGMPVALFVDYSVNSPFSLSRQSIGFLPLSVGDSETQSIDILNSGGSVCSQYQTTVNWVA